jgi:hypothetical protein
MENNFIFSESCSSDFKIFFKEECQETLKKIFSFYRTSFYYKYGLDTTKSVKSRLKVFNNFFKNQQLVKLPNCRMNGIQDCCFIINENDFDNLFGNQEKHIEKDGKSFTLKFPLYAVFKCSNNEAKFLFNLEIYNLHDETKKNISKYSFSEKKKIKIYEDSQKKKKIKKLEKQNKNLNK